MDELEVIQAAKLWLKVVRLYEKTDIHEREELDLAAAGMSMAKARYKRLLSAYVQKQIDMDEAQKRLEESIAELLNKGESQ